MFNRPAVELGIDNNNELASTDRRPSCSPPGHHCHPLRYPDVSLKVLVSVWELGGCKGRRVPLVITWGSRQKAKIHIHYKGVNSVWKMNSLTLITSGRWSLKHDRPPALPCFDLSAPLLRVVCQWFVLHRMTFLRCSCLGPFIQSTFTGDLPPVNRICFWTGKRLRLDRRSWSGNLQPTDSKSKPLIG